MCVRVRYMLPAFSRSSAEAFYYPSNGHDSETLGVTLCTSNLCFDAVLLAVTTMQGAA